MTLNGRAALYCTNDAFFGADIENLKNRPILSAAKMLPRDRLPGGIWFMRMFILGVLGDELLD